MYRFLFVLLGILTTFSFMSCADGNKTDVEAGTTAEIVEATQPDSLSTVTVAEVNEPSSVGDTAAPIHKMKLKFAKGTWEYEILDFIESTELKKSFVLDKVPFEGEELPAEAALQLDNLAEIQATFPFLRIEIQAHTSAAKNELAKKTKKVASKTRAIWVATKLNRRGVPNNMISSTGMGDDALISDMDPEDKGQRRIIAVLSK